MSADRSTALAASQPLERIRFRAGGIGLLCPQPAARELTPLAPVSRVPNSAPWMLGLMNVRGAPVPVVDLALAFHTAPSAQPAYALAFNYDGGAVALLVDGLPVWSTVAPNERLARIPACPEALRAHALVAYYESDRVWFDIDIHGLLRALSAAVTE